MKIWIINHYAVPTKYYPLARPANFAKYLIRMGHSVTIFAASTVHNSDINLIQDHNLFKVEEIDGIQYVYIKDRDYQGNGINRIINMFLFPLRLPKVCKNFEKPDAIIAVSATPMTCMAGLKLAEKFECKGIAEVADLWPESFVSYGLIKKKNPLLKIMYEYEKRMYMKADDIIFTMEGAYDYIRERRWENKIGKEKLHYINNGVDLEAFNANKEKYKIDDDDLKNPEIFKVIYTGSIRMVNNLGLLLDVAKIVNNKKIRFLIWGDGDELEFLKERLIKENIENVVFKGKVEKKYIPYIVSLADVNIIHNTPSPIFRFGISANKIFDYLAAGKPILADFPCRYNPIIKYSAGIEVENPTSENIADVIDKFSFMNTEEYERYCRNALKASKNFDFKVLTEKVIDIFKNMNSK